MIRGLQTPATGHDRAGEPGETDATLDKLDKMMSAKVGRRLVARDDNAEAQRHSPAKPQPNENGVLELR